MTRSAAGHVEQTPGVGGRRTGSTAPDTALRVGIGHYTIDILPDVDERGVATIVSNGQLGEPPIGGRVSVAIVAVVLATAGFVRARPVIHTAGWCY